MSSILRIFLRLSVVVFISFILAGDLSAQTNAPGLAGHVPAAIVTPYIAPDYSGTIALNYATVWEPQQPITSEAALLAATSATSVHRNTRYLDGLGRDLQSVAWQASADGHDIVLPRTYDGFGREPYKFLAYTSTASDGSFQTTPFSSQSSFYTNVYPADQPAYTGEQIFYSQVQYEASPLNRLTATLAAGNSWGGSNIGIGRQFLVNDNTDQVQEWNIGFDPPGDANNWPMTPGVYSPGTLNKNVTTDEQGSQNIEYKDLDGKVILRKGQAAGSVSSSDYYTGWLITYYIYDDQERLRFVIPPKATAQLKAANWTFSSTLINELCFRYEYDNLGRMIGKKVPGAGWIWMVYDQRDRLVFLQDANMAPASQWRTTVYDGMNRVVETGITTYSGTRSQLQAAVDLATATANPSTLSGTITSTTGVPAMLSINSRAIGQTLYQSSMSIEFDYGFESEDNASFTAQIVPAGNGATTTAYTVNVLSNPIPSGAAFIPLTQAFYDNYSWSTTKNYDNSNNAKLDYGNNTAANIDAVPAVASLWTNTLPTGSRRRVIENPADLTQGTWLETATFYDDKGRIIQVINDNYKGGEDISTNRYDFKDKPVCTYFVHNNPQANVSNFRIKTNWDYDKQGYLLETRNCLNDDASRTRVLAHNTYDRLGQLKSKSTGQKTDNNGVPLSGQFLENDAFTYNIRGWLKGINWTYGASGSSSPSVDFSQNKWFGMDLSYDWGFSTNQVNGNISGIRWKSGGEGQERAYGYGYDGAGRILSADFNQNFGGAWSKTDPNDSRFNIDFSVKLGTDGHTYNTAYDENGNILQMQQMGMLLNSSQLIDNLSYTYTNSGNRLLAVNDAITSNNHLGDFTDKNTTLDDFSYDANGNLQQDKNKGISLVSWNHLDLPYLMNVNPASGSTGTITYVYDAAGTKLEKRVHELPTSSNNNQDITTTSTYISGFVYVNNVLQFMGHEEGRIRPAINASGQVDMTHFVYDYFLKDHLGNVRTVLTDEWRQDIYPVATLENNGSSLQTEQNFYTINTADIVANMASSVPAFNSASGNVYYNNNGNPPYNPNPNSNVNGQSTAMYKLNGVTGDKTGLGITLRVMAGDVIDIWARSYYHVNGTVTNSNLIAPAVNALLASMAGTPVLAGTKATAAALSASPVTPPELQNLLNNIPSPTDRPKAFVNWILFDDQFRPVASASGTDAVAASGDQVYVHHQNTSGLQMPKNGYLYVYCSNESNQDVYFDNLQVIHTRGPLNEESSYYPYGLSMAGISAQALKSGYLNNKYGYNGKEIQSQEFTDGSGLEQYDYGARFMDPQLGVWHNIDPHTEKSRRWSPYAYAVGNPLRFIDPDGMDANDAGVAPYHTGYQKSEFERSVEDSYDPSKRYHGLDGGNASATTEQEGSVNETSDATQGKTIIINGVTHYLQKKTTTPLVIIHNAPVDRVINTNMEALSMDVITHKPMAPLEFTLPNFSKTNWPEVEMLQLGADFAFGGGIGRAIDVVWITKGNGRGIYFYTPGDYNFGLNAGVGVVAGEMHFNHSLGIKLDKDAFSGWSTALSAGVGPISGTQVRAYQDSKMHFPGMPGNPPILYEGVMAGYGMGVKFGGMITFSNATLIDNWSIPY